MGGMGVQVWVYVPEIISTLTFLDKIQGGSGEWVWGVKSHIFGICQKVFFRHKNENGSGVRASLTFFLFFF